MSAERDLAARYEKGSRVPEFESSVPMQPGGHERGLQRANEFHAVLLAMAGHDLRQPLQAIMAAYEWLAPRLTNSVDQEYLSRGRSAILNLTNQLDLLIEALRLHEHSANTELAPIPLEPIFSRLCRDNEDAASRKGVRLWAHRTSAVVMSDAVLLEGILRNLVRNAVKYTGPGGGALIGCRRRGALLKIEVLDTGIGIPRDKLSRVFDAFHQLDSTSSDGLGLGLFVVRRAVDLLGHSIEVRSTPGRGSCFSILAKAQETAMSLTRPAYQSVHSLSFCAGDCSPL